jgi:spore germination protein YaaH
VIRRSLIIAALATGAALAPAAAAHAADCGQIKPRAVKLKPNAAGDSVTVSWRVPGGAPKNLAFRVARDGAVVGQTSGRRMNVRVSTSRSQLITVKAVVGGRPTRCRVELRYGGAKVSKRVTGLFTARRGSRVRLSWDRGPRGTRYRIVRNGATIAHTRKTSFTVPAARSARYQVGAGRTPLSRRVIVKRGHVAPSAPVAPAVIEVTETSATLSWRASRAFSGRISSYRVVAGGRTLGTARGTTARVTGLVKGRAVSLRVVGVDSRGWTSKRSAAVKIVTGHHAPAAPAAPGVRGVTDTAVTLAWAPVKPAYGSKLRGYRIMRDGAVVTQVPATQVTIGNLAPKAAHNWTIAAVDTRGYASAPSPATRVTQAAPPPTAGGSQTFLLASTEASFAAFRKHYKRISVVYPTFYDCRGDGQITGSNDARIVSFAQDRKVRVLPRFNCQSGAVIHRILTETAMRSYWLNTLTSLMVQYGWDGINVDFEAGYASDRAAMTAFIAELSDRVHARGKLLSQAVSAKTEDVANHPRSTIFDYKELSKYEDYIFVMAWGIHWSSSEPGPQDDFDWVRRVGDYVATMPNQEKFVMGTMLYGFDWPDGGGPSHPATARHYSEIMALAAKYNAKPVFDSTRRSWRLDYRDTSGTPHEVWYSDGPAVGDRVALARARGLKVGFWRVGQEDERIWSDPRLPVGG